MARIRYLKPEFFTDEDLCELPFETRLAFAGLWCHADKAGRIEYRPKFLKAMIFPYDNVNLEKEIKKLAEKPFVSIYSVENKSYIQILTWEKHQRPHNTEKESEIPGIEKGTEKGMEKEKGTEKGSVPDATLALNNEEITLNNRYRELSLLLFDKIKLRNEKQKTPNFSTWDDYIRLIVEKDGKTCGEVEKVIIWCQEDSFWQDNILSTSKLREKFDQLYLKMNKSNNTPKKITGLDISMENLRRAAEAENAG